MKHPIQPIVTDEQGIIRFKPNKIVRYLLDNGGLDLNHLGRMNFDDNEWEQFAQLIGYSVSGWGGLSYVSNDSYGTVSKMQEGLDEKDAKNACLEERLDNVRKSIKEIVPELFRIAAEDLV